MTRNILIVILQLNTPRIVKFAENITILIINSQGIEKWTEHQ